MKFGADYDVLLSHHPLQKRPKWASNLNHSPFITNELLFVLHSIYTNMIAWCRSFSDHDLVGGQAIYLCWWGRFGTIILSGHPPKRPKWASNLNHSPFVTNDLLFVLHSIHTKMIAWCRSVEAFLIMIWSGAKSYLCWDSGQIWHYMMLVLKAVPNWLLADNVGSLGGCSDIWFFWYVGVQSEV